MYDVTLREVLVRREHVPLTRPYVIASYATDSVEIFYVALRDRSGLVGYGAASPAPDITGESFDDCAAALATAEVVVGADVARLGEVLGRLGETFEGAPAARAAVDMALHDLLARRLGVPLCALLGAPRPYLKTSITIGILPVQETLAEAREHAGHGFTCFKIKIGHDIDQDVERLRKLREVLGPDVALRVDANEGYDVEDAVRMFSLATSLNLELVEQPLARRDDALVARLGADARRLLAYDESAHSPVDAARLLHGPGAAGHLVIKLMKCGGIVPAREIAAIAHAAGAGVMWGCMDESAVSISAALHAALASPATRFLDLDGSFDLVKDLATGGFTVQDGVLIPNGAPGLGVHVEAFDR